MRKRAFSALALSLAPLIPVAETYAQPQWSMTRPQLEKKAKGGNANAMFNLAVMLARGDGGPQDLVAARDWYRRSAELGDGGGVERYGQMLGNGEGGETNIVLSVALLQIAADANYWRAQEWLQLPDALKAAADNAPEIAAAKESWLKRFPRPAKIIMRIPLR